MRLLVALLATLSGCLKAGEFRCATSADCDRGGAQGICQPNSFCSFADDGCASGQRFAELSGSVSGTCVDEGTPTFTVGGTLTGLTGSLTLNNNAVDPLILTSDGTFAFATPLADAAMYNVTVEVQPADQTCIVVGGTGTIASNPVTEIEVTCGAVSQSTILCASGVSCPTASEVCCFDRAVGMGVCQAAGAVCTDQRIECDSADDCGGGVAVCCAEYAGGVNLRDVTCRLNASACPAPSEIWCDPSAGAAACPAGQSCTGTATVTNPGYATCE